MTKYTIRIIEAETPEVIWCSNVETDKTLGKLLSKARDAFPEATSICVESEDGTSETIFVRKEK